MPVDFNSFTPKQLDSLIAKARQHKDRLARRKPAAVVRRQIVAILKKEGYELCELFSAEAAKHGVIPRPSRTLGKVPPKYRNPHDPEVTWSGRGKQPRWLVALIAKGHRPEEFLIRASRKK